MHKKETILVTGATGYIASWILKYLLEDGHTVHATVRNSRDTKKVQYLFDIAEKALGTLKLFDADLTQPGSFDAAAQGCEIVIHTASPFLTTGIKNAEAQLIKPAKEGTRIVLEAVLKAGVAKRVVLTSSMAAIHGDNADVPQNGKTFTEVDWNTTSRINHSPYSYSKTVAEEQGWEMANAQYQYAFTTINPGFVLGPSLTNRVDSVSISTIINMGTGRFKTGVPKLQFGMVDVRDVARAHILAALNLQASGRHICAGGVFSFLDVAQLLHKNFGDAYPFPKKELPKWLLFFVGPLAGFSWKFVSRNVDVPLHLDNSYIQKDLGITFRPLEETLVDQFNQLLAAGHIPKK